MALYSYSALSREGKKVDGTVDASSASDARDKVTKLGFFPVKIVLTHEIKDRSSWLNIFSSSRVSLKDKIFFTKQLSVLLKSGVPLLAALDLLVDQISRSMRSILISIRDDVKGGETLAEGMSKYPQVFDNIYVQLVRAGEASGHLEVILERLMEYMERRSRIARKIKSIMIYPIIQLIIISAVVTVLLAFVVPELATQFAENKAELPIATKILLVISDLLIGHYYILISGFLLTGFGLKYWKSTASGSLLIDRIKLRLPIIGFFTRIGTVVKFSRTLGMLEESGVNLAESLDIVCKIVDNRILANALMEAREKIIKQGKIAQYLEQVKLFPSMAIYLVRTGEESGQLGDMLLSVAKTYEDELLEFSDTLSTMLEPLMMIVMAGVVGFIVMAIAIPLMQMGDVMAGG